IVLARTAWHDRMTKIKASKIILIGVSALAAAVVVLATVTALVLRLNAKPQVEAIASEALGMQVHVGGRLTIGFLPGLHAALADVDLRQRGAEVASAAEVDLGIELLPLLHKELRTDRIKLKRLTLAVERDHDGMLNIDSSSEDNGTLPPLDVARVSASDATLAYEDKQSGKAFEATGCTLDASRLRLSGGGRRGLLKNVSFAAKLTCGQVRTKDSAASDLKLAVDAQGGIFRFDPITMQLFGGRGSGDVRAD